MDRFLDLRKLMDPLMVCWHNAQVILGLRLFDSAKYLDDQDGVMCRDRTARLARNVRMRYLLLVADIHDVIDAVGGILIERVIRRRVEERAAAVIVNAKSAADIDV